MNDIIEILSLLTMRLSQEIWLYAKERDLPYLECVRGFEKILLKFPRKLDNEFASKHKVFCAEVLDSTVWTLHYYGIKGKTKTAQCINLVGESFADMTDDFIKESEPMLRELYLDSLKV